MKKRETINLFLHIGVAAILAALVLFHHWFLLLATFIYAWLREQAQARYNWFCWATNRDGIEVWVPRKEDVGFFGWMTPWKVFEAFQWVIGAFVALVLYELWLLFG